MDYFDQELVWLDQKVDSFTEDTSHNCIVRLSDELNTQHIGFIHHIIGLNNQILKSHVLLYNLAMLDRLNDILNYITRNKKANKVNWLHKYNDKYGTSPFEYLLDGNIERVFLTQLQRFYEVKAERDNRPKTD